MHRPTLASLKLSVDGTLQEWSNMLATLPPLTAIIKAIIKN